MANLPEYSEFTEGVRAFETVDVATAELFNQAIQPLINRTIWLRDNMGEGQISDGSGIEVTSEEETLPLSEWMSHVRERENHTGTQTAATISDFAEAVAENLPVFAEVATTGEAQDVSVVDVGEHYESDNVESVLQEIGDQITDINEALENISPTEPPTKESIGLGDVDNTSDLDKPVSTATQDLLDTKADIDSPIFTGDVRSPTPTLSDNSDKVATTAFVMGTIDAVSSGVSNVAVSAPITNTGTGTSPIIGIGLATSSLSGAMSSTDKAKLDSVAVGAQANTVTSVAGKTGAVVLTKADVGLSGVDNTSDASKPISTATQTALNAKANSSVQIVAGTGLTGGGTLTTNRTLGVVYGTSAGTSAQGNDSRLSDSREWTASTVSQAEAEAGTSSTPRKWTAQRDRQATNAWWNSSADKAKLDGISAGAQANVATNLSQGTRTTTTVPVTSSTGSSATLTAATTSLAGVMSSADKTKLDGISAGATASSGTVTSVGLSVPTGFTGGGAVTTSGNLSLNMASGYSIPTTANQNNWNTAYGWGNHATAGYLKGNAIRVDTVAQLRALNNNLSSCVIVAGYYASGDGGGGVYLRQPSGSEADNGGSIIVDASNSRWKLMEESGHNVRQFGAKGDGVADDTSAFTRAIAAAKLDGRPVIVPCATDAYRITSTINVDFGLKMRGDGTSPYGPSGPWNNRQKGSWLKLDHSGAGFSFKLNNGSGFISGASIRSIGTMRSHADPTTVGWTPTVYDFDFLFNNTDFFMEDVMLLNAYKGVRLENGNAGRGTMNNVRGQCFNLMIELVDVFDTVRLEGIHMWPFWSNEEPVVAWMQDQTTFIRTWRCDNPSFSNLFSIFTNIALEVKQGANGVMNKLKATNWDMDVTNYGVFIEPGVEGVVAQFTNVTSWGPPTENVDSYNHRIMGNNCHLTFANLEGSNLTRGIIRVEGNNNVVDISAVTVGDTARAVEASPIFDVMPGNILRLRGQLDKHTPSQKVYDGGGVFYWPDFANYGISTIVSGTNSVDVVHGLARTPTHGDISIKAATGPAGSGSFWLDASNITATTFTIRTENMAEADIAFSWEASLKS